MKKLILSLLLFLLLPSLGWGAISDNFAGDLSKWTTTATNFSIVSGELKHNNGGGASIYESIRYSNEATPNIIQWAKLTLRDYAYGVGIALRMTADPVNDYFYVIYGYNTNTRWRSLKGYVQSTSTDIATDTTSITWADLDVMGVTIVGTGNDTIVRVWKNPIAASPINADSWDAAGDHAIEWTTNPTLVANTGTYIGVYSILLAGTAGYYDNFSGGSVSSCSGGPYYISTTGNNENNGTSTDTSWTHAPGMPGETGVPVSCIPVAGDVFYFKRGDTWAVGTNAVRMNYGGTGGTYITWDGASWGSGDNAKFTIAASRVAGQYAIVNIAGNDYFKMQHFIIDAQNNYCRGIVIGNNTSKDYGPITQANETYITLDDITILNIGSAGSTYNSGILVQSCNDTISNIDLLNITTNYTGCSGIALYPLTGTLKKVTNVLIRNCNISNFAKNGTDSNSGIEIKNNVENVIIEHCTIYDGDAVESHGIDLQTADAGFHPAGIIIRWNLMYNITNSFISLLSGEDQDISIYGNILRDNVSGYGIILNNANWAGAVLNIYNNTLYNIYDDAIAIGGIVAGSPTINVKNNIVYKTCAGNNKACILDANGAITSHSNNNLYCYDSADTYVVRGTSDWARTAWVVGWGDSGGKSSDPLFVSTSDFRPQPSSPAINAGVDVGLTQDYSGRPVQLAPDIGAYEYEIRRKRVN